MADYFRMFFIFPFITLVISFFFGLYSIYFKPLGKTSISFSIYSFGFSIIALSTYILTTSSEINIAEMAARISNLFVLLSMPALFIFTVDLIQIRLSHIKGYYKVLFFLPFAVLGMWLFFQKPELIHIVNYGFIQHVKEFTILGPALIIPFNIAIIVLLSISLIKNYKKKYYANSVLLLLLGVIAYFIVSSAYSVLYELKIVGLIPVIETMNFLQYIFSSIAILSVEQNLRSFSYKKLLENIDDAVIILDGFGTIININIKMKEILEETEKKFKNSIIFNVDYFKQQLLKRTIEIKKVENITNALSFKENNYFSDEISLSINTKEQKYYNVIISPIKAGKLNVSGKFAIFRDITAFKIKENELKYLSFHDSMTGLYNRTFMQEEFNRLDVQRQLPLGVVMGDINGLKIINDSFGHNKGDELICKIASILKRNFRSEDIISRWGGDEFLILLPKTSINDADSIITRIKSDCKQKGTADLPLSISLGTAVKTNIDQELVKIIKDAEDCMYSYKFEEQRSFQNSLIATLEKTLEEKDFDTEAHAKRLKELVTSIGKELKLSNKQLNELSLLSALHDLGKVAVADSVLSKPGKLTPEEWEMIKKHPEAGYRIAETSANLAPIAEGILYHHERWDGKGYPRGLGEKNIPLNARIINIVDSFDAMTHKRPYQATKSKQEAIEELKRCSGTQFDPELVEVLIKILG
jgi:diguanylate cyclase (GGDEF)-like protein